MSNSFPMTSNSFEAKINGIKRRSDVLIAVSAQAIDDVLNISPRELFRYRKHGGLHFAKVGPVSFSWSVKKKPKAALPEPCIEVIPTSDELQSRISRFVR